MADLPLRARSATEIVDAAFQLYRRDAAQYVLITGLAYAPWLVIRLVALGARGGPPAGTPGVVPSGLEIVATVGEFLAFSLMTAVVVRLGSDAYHGRPLNVGAATRDVLPRLPAIIGASLVQFVLAVIGFVLLIIPALYVVARFFATTQVIVLEGRGAFSSLGRSSELSNGRKLHILGTIGLVFVIYFVVSFGIMLLAELVGSRVLTTVLEALYVVVAFPLIGLCSMLLYYDARIRVEAYDVEVMTGTLDPVRARP
ncbi:MAG: hypothetical protein ABR499_03935 [Gemmatimonadaceae bacterium]